MQFIENTAEISWNLLQQFSLSWGILDDWDTIFITGSDAENYLQGQLTCDVTQLSDHGLMRGAQCALNGKVISCFYLFRHERGYLLLEPRNTIAIHIASLVHYAKFSTVTITKLRGKRMVGILGEQAPHFIKNHYSGFRGLHGSLTDPQTMTLNDTLLICFPGTIPRYLLIADSDNPSLTTSLNELYGRANCNQEKLWSTLELLAYFPMLDRHTSEKFSPQALGLDRNGAVSYSKGCYLGQEIVARTTYRKPEKKVMRLVLLDTEEKLPRAGKRIEAYVANRATWQYAGIVLASFFSAAQSVIAQVMLRKPFDKATKFRVASEAE